MDKATIKAFIAWLDAATLAEIEARQGLIRVKKRSITTSAGRADLALALRLIDEELLSRLELAHLESPRQAVRDA